MMFYYTIYIYIGFDTNIINNDVINY